jgi:hypothetical protein
MSDDSPDGSATQGAGDSAPGLLITMKPARRVILLDRFGSIDAILGTVARRSAAMPYGNATRSPGLVGATVGALEILESSRLGSDDLDAAA